LFSTEALLNPYPLYQELRQAGGLVWLEQIRTHALPRFDEVLHALRNPGVFSSSAGVTLNDWTNRVAQGSTISSDPPKHTAMRRVLERPLGPKALAQLRERIFSAAEALVERLVAKRRFDAATELAQFLPLEIVTNLVGVPLAAKERMLEWATAGFDLAGPLNVRTKSSLAVIEEMFLFSRSQLTRDQVKPGSWCDLLFEAGDRGELPIEQCRMMMQDYIGPSLDTTIAATASAIWLFARNPDQWDRLRREPRLVAGAVNEVIRLESPVSGFSRTLAADATIAGVSLPFGARIFLIYASANRDERKWQNADRFQIGRDNRDHLGFGHGIHACVGSNLARLEIIALLTALSKRVRHFEILHSNRRVNSVIRGWTSLMVEVTPD
jgi:cytochrome P450